MSSHRLFGRLGLLHNGCPRRHWSPESEKYAPADVLLAHLRIGWQVEKAVFVEAIHHAHHCCWQVFHFTLRREDKTLCMPVLATPAVFHVIGEYKLTVLPFEAQGDWNNVEG